MRIHRKEPTNRRGSAASHHAGSPFSILNSQFSIPRRGTVLVFVLGILTLLALVGLVLIARTHGEFQRVTLDGNAANNRGVLDGLVGSIQDTLRQDIWGQTPNQLYPLQPRPTADNGDIRENNEPFDAPGIDDRWLASLTPYNAGTAPPTGSLSAIPPPIGNPMALEGEYNVLAWPNVSYIGVDLLAPAGQKPAASASPPPNQGVRPFVWASNSRVPAPLPAVPVWYKTEKILNNPDSLKNICILQTPPVGVVGNLIPGSTTNVTIAQSRETWLGQPHQTALAALPEFAVGSSPRVPQFPYFDTNADGILDLYDADGDGVPDSPLSLRIPVTSGDANAPHDLYAAVRIVDHNAMLNVNTASSLRRPNGTNTDLAFNEARAGLQRRGQRASELLLDDVVHLDDRDYENIGTDRAKGLVGVRNGDFPDAYDREWIRTKLLGGRHTGLNAANLYGLSDESALRHRGTLVPYDRRFESQTVATDYTNIDRALRGTLQWGRGINGGVTYDVGGGVPAHWNRFNSNFGSLDYEGSDVPPTGAIHGWRSMMTEDEPYAIRRHMLTTVSNDVMPMPDLIKNVTLAPGDTDTLLEKRLKQLWSLGMDWPVLIASDSTLIGLAPPYWSANSFSQKFVIAPAQMPPEHFRAQPIDLNMGDIDQPAAKEAFIRYAAAAMYMALEDIPETPATPLSPLALEIKQYQGIVISGASFKNQEYLAWQFAVNLADYRDADNEPTVWEWPVGLSPPHYVFGIEKQPFFTEAYAFLKAGVPPGPAPSSGSGPDKWWFAVELFVPPYWKLDAGDLSLRIPRPVGPPTILPIASAFKHRTNGTFPTVLDGDTTGRYYVFCGINANAPMWATGNPVSYPLGSGYNDFYQIVPTPGATDLQLPTDGTGRIELWYSNPSVPQHVIDVIGPQYSADRLDADPSISPPSGPASSMTTWAARPGIAIVDDTFEFSLIRCTLGWRFTTAWHHFEWEREVLIPSPTSGRPVPKSLGRSNEPFPNNPLINRTKFLYKNIPESIWPARASVDISGLPTGILDLPATPLNGFAPSQAASNPYSPYPAFDSPADLSKILLVGPLSQQGINPPAFQQDSAIDPILFADFPATAALASMIQYGSNTSPIPSTVPDQPPASDLAARVATGRINFAPYTANLGKLPPPWVGRLFNFFTTQSPLFDGVDNDGNGITDLGQLGTSVFDPLEAWAVTHRAAGRLNVNTAPAHVLRSVPYMSLLPTSPEFLFHSVMGGGINPLPPTYNPYATYFSQPAPKPFWDFASVIVARRENREVKLRMWDPTYTPNLAIGETNMRTVAIAGPPPVVPGPAPSSGSPLPYLTGPVRSLSDLQRLYDRTDKSVTADPYLFRIDRFISDPTLRLPQHRYQTDEPMPGVGTASPLSPDFRFRRTGLTTGILDYPTIPSTAPLAAPQPETGGLRARDALLSRWANSLTVRSDVFTAYIALIDENGNYVRRSQVTFDRSSCFRETAPGLNATRTQIQPQILHRTDTNYSDDTK